jgi:filamentous hemagglutinin
MHYLYGKDIQVQDLTADQKSTISAIVGLGGAAIGATGSAADVTQGSMAAVNAVENNSLKAVVAIGKIIYKARNRVVKNGRIKMDDLKKIVKDEGFDILDNVMTLADGTLSWDDALAVIDLVVGSSLNGASKGKALEKINEIVGNSKKPSAIPTQPLDVGSYKDLKAREKVGDNLEHDHIPSFAALKANKEKDLGRKLTPEEDKFLYQNATAVEVPKGVHQQSPTYKGRNTAAQVQQDANNLCGAICRDTEALRSNMLKLGYNPKLVDDAINQIKARNNSMGVRTR